METNKVAYKDGKRIGKIVYETTLYIIKMDDDSETYAYADLCGWDVGEVKDTDGLHETINVVEDKK